MTFPRATILVVDVSRANFLETGSAKKFPVAITLMLDPIKHGKFSLAPAAGLTSNSRRTLRTVFDQHASTSLPLCAESTCAGQLSFPTLSLMFCPSTLGPLPPHFERTRLHFPPHQVDHLARRQAELSLNRVEACPVFPRHHDDSVNLFRLDLGLCPTHLRLTLY